MLIHVFRAEYLCDAPLSQLHQEHSPHLGMVTEYFCGSNQAVHAVQQSVQHRVLLRSTNAH